MNFQNNTLQRNQNPYPFINLVQIDNLEIPFYVSHDSGFRNVILLLPFTKTIIYPQPDVLKWSCIFVLLAGIKTVGLQSLLLLGFEMH